MIEKFYTEYYGYGDYEIEVLRINLLFFYFYLGRSEMKYQWRVYMNFKYAIDENRWDIDEINRCNKS